MRKPLSLPEPASGISHSGTRKTSFLYWLCQLSGWGLLFLINWNFTRQSGSQDMTSLTLIWLFGSLTGLALSHAWRQYLKNRLQLGQLSKLPLLRLTGGIIVLGGAEVLLVFSAFMILNPAGTVRDWRLLPNYLPVWITVFLIWTALYVAVQSGRRARRFELEKLRLEVNVKDAELRALQAQVNPHFFFNSLNSLRGLIYEDQVAAAQMLDKLAGMMRYSLGTGQQDTVPLAQELEAVHNYLAIEKIRFEERLVYSEEIPADLEDIAVPVMLLQTLIENAIKYGVESSMAPCAIRLSVQTNPAEQASVLITVANQGSIGRPASSRASTKLGLQNTAQRLQILFGDRASVRLTEHQADQQSWVHATLSLPRQIGQDKR
ncbi:histidine kinase [Undibacterium sp. Jales W-56]|uniref:sensor histidine kinase n=1 Tax=Undibacterium sp. Jales W-56 TaxID=2897325 RepID=UPI0021D3AC12|nr:histidine kinase [Undibacterium sp. Jales W-56]MCU6434217.1 histidine kinase [Undibacterium sp. Jales W-56]